MNFILLRLTDIIFHVYYQLWIGKTTITSNKAKSYVDSDAIRSSNDNFSQLNRTPRRLFIHGGINDDPEAAAHHFPSLSLGGEGDPAFLDTLLSFYNE